jgi:3'-5' exoribonuclease
MNRTDHLIHYTSQIGTIKLGTVCDQLFENPKFLTWPAAIGYHHAYEGGLLTHTCEVAELALHIASGMSHTDRGVKRDILLAAALWHDWGKTREYIEVETYAARDGQYRHLVREDPTKAWIHDAKAESHILTSAFDFAHHARLCGLDQQTTDAVVHCILAHHGPVKEWGSPTPPRTLEALILHQADMLSAGYGATK